MQLTRDQLVAVLSSRGQDYRAARAATDLPELVDSLEHAQVLGALGIDLDTVFAQRGPYDWLAS